MMHIKNVYEDYMSKRKFTKKHRYKNKRRVLYRKYNKKFSFFMRYMQNLTSIALNRVLFVHRYSRIGAKVRYFHFKHKFFMSRKYLRFDKPRKLLQINNLYNRSVYDSYLLKRKPSFEYVNERDM